MENQLKLEQQYRRQAALAEIGLAVNQPQELQSVLQRVAELTTELLPASAGASVLLWNAQKEAYIYSASTVPQQKPQTGALRARTQGGATRWIIDHQQSLAVPDVRHDRFSMNQLTLDFGIQAYAGVPLLAEGEVLGVLYALDEQPRPYTQADLDFMTALASRAALAIVKVRLYERLRATNKLLEERSAELQQRTADLEVRNAELDGFTHTVAHDLKAPLALIVGFASLLESDEQAALNDDQRLALRTITQTGFRMRNIINELLLLASVRKQQVDMQPLDMAAIVAEAQTRLRYLIDEYEAEIILPGAWPTALGHGPWIEEVWTNYLSNGIKYGGRPPRLELGASEQAAGMVRFWVTDNGPGIAVEDRSRLFAPFTQLSQVRAEGHGLGLSIVHRIIQKCEGQVGVDSEVGAGSTFWFTLPGA
ncbi:MAG TPA: ATP-binding protein [Anaerolineae bacterium]